MQHWPCFYKEHLSTENSDTALTKMIHGEQKTAKRIRFIFWYAYAILLQYDYPSCIKICGFLGKKTHLSPTEINIIKPIQER